LKYSINYVKKDLEILRPKMLIIPKTIYEKAFVQEAIRSIVPECLVIPIYQMNSRNINHSQRIKKYPKKKPSDLEEQFVTWQKYLGGGITGKTNNNFYSVYSYIEKIFEKQIKK